MHSPGRQPSGFRLEEHEPLVSLGVPLVSRLAQLEISRSARLRLCATDQNLVNGDMDCRGMNVSMGSTTNGLINVVSHRRHILSLTKYPMAPYFQCQSSRRDGSMNLKRLVIATQTYHNQEAHTNSLADLDELALVGCTRLSVSSDGITGRSTNAWCNDG